MPDVKLIHGDCLEILPTLTDKIDAVITDPPYPDYYTEEYKYFDGILEPLKKFTCRQIIFWSAKAEFPLDYSAEHIWYKVCGAFAASEFEKIFERNGGKKQRVFPFGSISSPIAAQIVRDIYTGHKSQKPIQLLTKLSLQFTKEGDTILDPFIGSGTTGVACVQTGRNFIGIEIDEKYFSIAQRRIKDALQQPNLFHGGG